MRINGKILDIVLLTLSFIIAPFLLLGTSARIDFAPNKNCILRNGSKSANLCIVKKNAEKLFTEHSQASAFEYKI